MTSPDPASNPLSKLATAGERLGWIFNDRNQFRRPFDESPPQRAPIDPELHDRLGRAERGRVRRVLIALGGGVGLAVLIGCCGGILTRDNAGAQALVWFMTGLLFLGGTAGAILAGIWPALARRSIAEAEEKAEAAHAVEHSSWDSRRQWHDQQQQNLVDEMPEWSAATPSPGTRRIDIVGGTTYGWEAVLTVFGGSLLATRGRLVLADFTGEALAGELMQLAETTGRSVREVALPAQLAEFDLVAGLEPAELVDGLVEAMYGDVPGGGNRAERSQDALYLNQVASVLAPNVTMRRLLAALRPGHVGLAPDEAERLAAFRAEDARVRRIEAFLQPLEAMGSAPATTAPADLTCLIAEGGTGRAQHELLKDLMVQWLSHQVRRESAPIGSLLLLGADEIDHRALERLSTLCERRGIRLVLFFQHLRAETLRTIGGGEVALMRLGNHQEAAQAAEFVGRGHKFVLSRLTRSLGGEETHTVADMEGGSETKGGTKGERASRHGLRRYTSTNWSKTRNWSQTESTANGTNWSNATSEERVYEYVVEPRALQDLPEYAMVLVKSGSVVQAVEVDPAIVTLPRVSMDPLGAPAPPQLPPAQWGTISDAPDRSTRGLSAQ
ncbi:hypothetical protein Aab01nite_58650 [Paractinoplanes abujensis]|uniref:Uncharacterized protein n=1 Tax=Paractinoplanes abujensis TaxID=882441 RepID=A0A7W7CX79_9ACTN|nr:hypothetical protein [Actinoplanes abujensis]MBB4696283.1 hypothetical protein [Actinoplanes abujensis]GID22275.1 hypothetical protein Aab01nite_58650 [Actinoplanes abujensis]